MILSESLRMAASSLWGHKTRSLLTILGVVIGVSSVLAVVTLGQSFEGSVVSQFDDVDNRAVFVTATLKSSGNNGPPNAGAFGNVFTSYDRDQLAALDGVSTVNAEGQLPTAALVIGGKTVAFRSVTATDSQNADLVERDGTVYASGGVFKDGASEMVLGSNVAQLLGNITGTPVTAGTALTLQLADGSDVEVTVAGVLAKSDSLFGQSNNQVYVPLDPFYTLRIQSPNAGQPLAVFGGFTVMAESARNVESVRDAVKAYFTSGTSDAEKLISSEAEIQVATQGDIVSAIGAVFDQVTLFIGAIAVVSLVVGAIGIANIMFVSVTERTREIGVLKAIGARDGEILQMFLLEATLIGVLGSVIGVALGLGLGALVVKGVFAEQGVAIVWPVDFIAIAVAVGILVGVLAGLIPARKATKIQPIQALSYE